MGILQKKGGGGGEVVDRKFGRRGGPGRGNRVEWDRV